MEKTAEPGNIPDSEAKLQIEENLLDPRTDKIEDHVVQWGPMNIFYDCFYHGKDPENPEPPWFLDLGDIRGQTAFIGGADTGLLKAKSPKRMYEIRRILAETLEKEILGPNLAEGESSPEALQEMEAAVQALVDQNDEIHRNRSRVQS